MKKSFFMGLILLMGLLCACASGARQGTVYVDPKAAAGETAQSGEGEKPEQVLPGEKEAPEPEEEQEEEYIFRSGSIAIVPLEEADEVMERLTGLLSTFEADSCAYQGKDYYYYYPGFELTVNELEGAKRITAITLVDDTIKAEFSGGALGIGDGEQLHLCSPHPYTPVLPPRIARHKSAHGSQRTVLLPDWSHTVARWPAHPRPSRTSRRIFRLSLTDKEKK